MTTKQSGFSIFNKTESSDNRSLQSILNEPGDKKYSSDNHGDKKYSSSRYTNTRETPSFTKETKRPFSSKFDTINENKDRKQLVFGKKPNDNNEFQPTNYSLKNKTELPNQPRKVFRSKFDAINENQDRKQLVFGKKNSCNSNTSELTKFRDLIIDPKMNNNGSNQSHEKSKKKTEIEIYREHIKKIEGNDSWGIHDDPSITTFVLGDSVIDFRNLTPEQFKFYQEAVEMANRSIDKQKNKEIENIDPKFKYKHKIIDKLWRNRDLPIQSWDYVLTIIEKMDYNYKKFIKEYIEVESDEKNINSQLRNISKKLKKIQILEKKLKNGKNINNDQKSSIDSKTHYLLKQSIYEGWLSWMNDESDEESHEESYE